MKRHSSDSRPVKQRQVARESRKSQAVDFFNVLTGPELLETTEAHMPKHRERLYTPTVTLSMFIKQALNADGSCQKVVNGWAAQRAAEGLSEYSVRTGPYCKARARLPVEMVKALTRETGRQQSARAPAFWRWRKRIVKLMDGTTMTMPDTPENQAIYPQPNTQAAGVGFPIARLVGVICLSTGAVLDAAMGPYEGKGTGETGLFRRLLDAFSPGDIGLGDALFCNYFLLATLMARGVDGLFEQNGARITDFRRGHSLGKHDHLVHWPKPKQRPEWMTPQQYDAFPAELLLREVKVDGQVLVTTLLDHRTVRPRALSKLYGQRWNVELDLRNIKTTLQMDTLSCQTPEMNEKEMWVHLLAYNLIRLLMAQAALNAGICPRQISFKHTVQLWSEWHVHPLRGCSTKHSARLFELIAEIRVGNRPGRIEPRVIKRRPKAFPLLMEPRAKARARVAAHGHP